MKTTNKIQKTALTAVAAAGLAIISFASNAQPAIKSLFEDFETNHIAMVMGKTNNSIGPALGHNTNLIGANAYAAYLTADTEEPMELEDWMMNEASFATMAFIEAETESPMEIEDWMLNESNFNATFSFKTETENEMILEDWMTNESNFDVNSFSFETEAENEMILEDWMTNENIFDVKQEQNQAKVKNKIISTGSFIFSDQNDESKLKIEDWMINPSVWK